MLCCKPDTPNTAGRTTHGAHICFTKTHGLAFCAEQHHVTVSLRDCGANQHIALLQLKGAKPHATLSGKVGKWRLLDCAVGSSHKNEVALGVFFYRQNRRDSFALFQRQQIYHWPPTGVTSGKRDMKHF